MIVVGHQPEFLPYFGFFDKLSKADIFVIVDNVQYRKKYFQNRNKIKTANGWIWLTVPVITKGRFDQQINEVRINNSLNWEKKHLSSLEMNYKKAPYFEEYYPSIKEIYSRDWELLVDLNETLIRYLVDQLDIEIEVFKGSDLGITGEKTDLLIDICRKTGADKYLQGAGGKDYVEEDKFQKEGLKVLFNEFTHPEYPQLFGDFMANLSVIDLLFNVGAGSKNYFNKDSL